MCMASSTPPPTLAKGRPISGQAGQGAPRPRAVGCGWRQRASASPPQTGERRVCRRTGRPLAPPARPAPDSLQSSPVSPLTPGSGLPSHGVGQLSLHPPSPSGRGHGPVEVGCVRRQRWRGWGASCTWVRSSSSYGRLLGCSLPLAMVGAPECKTQGAEPFKAKNKLTCHHSTHSTGHSLSHSRTQGTGRQIPLLVGRHCKSHHKRRESRVTKATHPKLQRVKQVNTDV